MLARSLYVFLAFSLVSFSANAFQAPAINTQKYGQLEETSLQSYIKDELLGLRTGSLTYSSVDVELEGLGPTIQIRRTFSGGSNGPQEFGSWELDLPRIVLTTNPSGWPAGGAEGVNSSAGICGDYSNPKFKGLNGTTYSSNWHTEAPVLYLGNGQSDTLLTVRSDLKGNHFPLDIRYATVNNVIVSCMSVNGRWDGFKVKTPDGLTYELTRLSRMPVDLVGGAPGKNIVHVTRIIDPSGNSVHFDYGTLVEKTDAHSYSYAKPKRYYLTRIWSSDGREVDIKYQQNALEGEYPLIQEVSIDNGGEIEGGATWKYSYTGLTSDMQSQYCHFLNTTPADEDRCRESSRRWYQGTYLKRVDLPDGSYWAFENRGPVVGSVLDCCTVGGAINHLTKVRVPTGAEITYTFDQLPYFFFDDSELVFETPVVSRKKVSDPVTGDIHEWKYAYAKLENQNSTRTIETDPKGNQVRHWFYRSGDYRGLTYKEESFEAGKLVKKVEYTHEKGLKVGDFIGHVKAATNYLDINKRVIDGRYTRAVLSRDKYFRETQVEESGNATRNLSVEYVGAADLEPELWMLNLIKEKTYQMGASDSASVIQAFDSLGRVTSIDRFGVKEAVLDYGDSGELIKNSHEASEVIAEKYSNHKYGMPQLIENTDGSFRRYKYDVFGNVIEEVDELGNISRYQYDALGRLRSHTPPTLEATTISYRANTGGSPSKLEVFRGGYKAYEITYDGLGNPIEKITTPSRGTSANGDIESVQFRYDHNGNLVLKTYPYLAVGSVDFSTSPQQPSLVYERDSTGRVNRILDTSTGGNKEYCYEPVCHYSSEKYVVGYGELIVDEKGYKKINKYNCYGDRSSCQVIEIRNKLNNPSKIGYVYASSGEPDEWVVTKIKRNVIGNIRRLDRGGVSRIFHYYPGGKLLKKQLLPESGEKYFSYYKNGYPKGISHGGQNKQFIYDHRGLLRNIIINGSETLSAQYYQDGNLRFLSGSNDGVETKFEYTGFGSVRRQINRIGDTEMSLAYSYNSVGDLNAMIYPDTEVVEYSPDLLGRVTEVVADGRSLASVSRMVRKDQIFLDNGIVIGSSRDPRGYEVRKKAERDLVSIPSESVSRRLFDQSYEYSLRGNLLKVVDNITPPVSRSMAYDGLGQLVYDGKNYDYDHTGNILNIGNRRLSYNNKNQLVTVNGDVSKAYRHDEMGRVNSVERSPGGISTLTYNSLDRVQSISEGDKLVIYQYDLLGNLVSTAVERNGEGFSGITYLQRDIFGRLVWQEQFDAEGSGSIKKYYYADQTLVADKLVSDDIKPTVAVDSVLPVDGSDQIYLLKGSASAPNGDDLSGSITWQSNKDGVLGKGQSIDAQLSVGVHEISASVPFSNGSEVLSEVKTVTVQPKIELQGKVREITKDGRSDYELSLSWTPSTSEPLEVFFNGEKLANVNVTGESEKVLVRDVEFSSDDHVYVCRSGSVVCSDVLSVNLLHKLNRAPTLSAINKTGTVRAGGFATFSATANDFEQGDISVSIKWYYYRNGSSSGTGYKQVPREPIRIGSGKSVRYAFSDFGSYTVIAKVEDNQGKEITRSVVASRNLDSEIYNLKFIPPGQALPVPSFLVYLEIDNMSDSSRGIAVKFKPKNYGSASWVWLEARRVSGNRYEVGPIPDGSLMVCSPGKTYCKKPAPYSGLKYFD